MHRLDKVKLKRMTEYAIDGRVLDVGCSANPNPYLQDATGIDIAPPNVTPPSYREIVACNLNRDAVPFADGSFSNVLAGDVIEHLENPSHFLREMNRVLTSGGRLIISTPQANDWWVTLHNWFFRGIVRDPDRGEHLQNWTILDMTRLLKKNGFQVRKIEGFVMKFPKLALYIPVRHVPVLSWQVFYVAEKVSAPDKGVLAHVDGAWRTVAQ